MQKKDSEPKRGSGSDNEKSPGNPTSKDDGEPMEEVEQSRAVDNETKSTTQVESGDPEGDFVLVEGGGEIDEMSQEKAAEKKKNGEEVSAGAQPPENVESAAATEPVAEMKGMQSKWRTPMLTQDNE